MEVGRIVFNPQVYDWDTRQTRPWWPASLPSFTVTPRFGKKPRPDKQMVRVDPLGFHPGRLGELLTTVMLAEEWVVVLWEGDTVPETIRFAGLELL